MSAPLVSILVPTYNARRFLGALIASVLGQTYDRWELLILDDGSGDLDDKDVSAWLSDPRIRCFRWQPNRGVSQATRFLMQHAKGEYWCYPGADDLLRPSFIETRLGIMAGHPEISLVFGKGGQIDEDGREVWFELGRGLFDQMKDLEGQVIDGEQMLRLLLAGNIINTPSIMARCSATLPILLRYTVDWRYCQDWFYWLLLAAHGVSFYYDGEMLHDYRFHEASMTQSPATWAWRNVEPALVLLTGLRLAAQASDLGAEYYRRCRMELYGNWLVRSFRFRAHPSMARWASLAAMVNVHWIEWPMVSWAALRVHVMRRQSKRQGRVLHGLPSFYFSERLFASSVQPIPHTVAECS